MLDFGFYNMDCLEGMKQFPDKFFDLAIVDPPYGGGAKSGEDAKIIGGGVRIGSISAGADSADGSTVTTSTQPQKLRGGGGLKAGIQDLADASGSGSTATTLTAAPITYAATGGKWSARYRQRCRAVKRQPALHTGTLHRRKSTLTSWQGSAKIR